MAEPLRLVVRTPHAVVLDAPVRSVRIPTDTGQVGVRSGREPAVLALEPGLVVIRAAGAASFASTAGGLADVQRGQVTLFTPFAAAGADGPVVLAALEQALAREDQELAARRKLGALELRIVGELRRPRRAAPGGRHG